MRGLTLALIGVLTHLPNDSVDLRLAAREFGVPPIVMFAIAIQESGYAGGNAYTGPGVVDSIGIAHCREVGRLQVRPCDAWGWLTPHCRHLDIYRSNIRCGAAILAYRHMQTGSWLKTVEKWNGKGRHAREYTHQIQLLIGKLILLEEDESGQILSN